MADNNISILDSIKKNLGIDAANTIYDPDIIMHINSTFFTLHQLGVGPVTTFSIQDKNTNWISFIDDDKIEAVKSYITLKVRILFDPPSTSYGLEHMNKLASEYEWRLSVQQEGEHSNV